MSDNAFILVYLLGNSYIVCRNTLVRKFNILRSKFI